MIPLVIPTMPTGTVAISALTVEVLPPPFALLRIRWCRFTSAALTRPVLKPALEYATSFLPSLLSWRCSRD